MRLTDKHAADHELVLEWLYSERCGRIAKWEKRLCAYRKCSHPRCFLAQQYGGASWHYCTAPDSHECMYATPDYKPGGYQWFRADTAEREPMRFRRDWRTQRVIAAWRQGVTALDGEAEVVRLASQAYRSGEWEPLDAVTESRWPKLTTNARRMRAQEDMAKCIAAYAVERLRRSE